MIDVKEQLKNVDWKSAGIGAGIVALTGMIVMGTSSLIRCIKSKKAEILEKDGVNVSTDTETEEKVEEADKEG